MSKFSWNSEACERNYSGSPPELNFTVPTCEKVGATRHDWTSLEIQSNLPIDILLITVKEHEFLSCYSNLKNVKRGWCDDLGMVDFGDFGDKNVKVALIRCEVGPMAALLLVKNAAEILNPKVAIFVGFCASVNPTEAKLGDVVISAKLATYSSKKITADGTEELRGIKANVSRNMARLILSAHHGWVPPLKDPVKQDLEVTVHCQAVMLSGPELVNYRERRQELLRHYPDAIALDIGGEGLYAAAYELQLEWAIIKGISDFADGRETAKADWQPFASAMAASLVYHMFKYPDVIRQWPHYKRVEPRPAEERNKRNESVQPERHYEEIKPKEVVIYEGRVLAEKQEIDPEQNVVYQGRLITNEELIDRFIRRLEPKGSSGQFTYDDRTIKYKVVKRYPSVLATCSEMTCEATAVDETTGIKVTMEGFKDESKAVKYTVRALLEKLEAKDLL